jgi:hypothetical protein
MCRGIGQCSAAFQSLGPQPARWQIIIVTGENLMKLEHALNIADLRKLARRRLPRVLFDVTLVHGSLIVLAYHARADAGGMCRHRHPLLISRCGLQQRAFEERLNIETTKGCVKQLWGNASPHDRALQPTSCDDRSGHETQKATIGFPDPDTSGTRR